MITRVIDRNFANMRLDRFLRQAFPNEPLSTFFAILRKKKVRVNGVHAKAPQILLEGDTVDIYENFKSVPAGDSITPTKKSWGTSPEFADRNFVKENLVIALEKEDFVVLDKPSGIASQPGTGTRKGESLVEMLWQWGKDQQLDFKPTLAHRLDEETSGLIIAALHGDTLRDLTRLLREHKIQKTYIALIKGNLKKDAGTINASLERTDSKAGSKMKAGTESGKKSVTHYVVQQHLNGYDLVKVNLETGRMHQIRAHFESIGHPLLGDTRYGDFELNREFKKEFGLKRLFLHSTRLEFDWQGKRIIVDSALPKELRDVVKALKKK
ncbi:MAG: RluA family pseudouridine synthase [Hallerella porci]|uniref:Ribosomal large subunit pseudouridine synthase C n=1 Tax=Hallerella porci TaxID=1945871 RepID=A0ABX5LIL1_9BACT|nr:RluA family pseudouridine synthase [Hallerella porci]MDY3921573.1 RluA family pseudouridine synthase [Hallerella porci]PWK93644.1 RluA family pseudouridine synthase [Hallerella porci]